MRGEAWAAAAASALLAWAALQAPHPPAPGMVAFHHDSVPAGREFQEVFCVAWVHPRLAAAPGQLSFLLDGQPLRVQWQDADGRLGAGDRFWFIEEAFDAPRTLEAHRGNETLWRATFGGASANPVHPCP